MLRCNDCEFCQKVPVYHFNHTQNDGYCTLNPTWIPILAYEHYCGQGMMRQKFDKTMISLEETIGNLKKVFPDDEQIGS
jgi:hypothetical protein